MDRGLGNTICTSLVTNSIILLLIATSVSGEWVTRNRANVSAECDQTYLHTTFKFERIFRGSIFITDFYFDEICRFMFRLSNETEFNISFPMNPCEFDVIESGRKTFSRTTIRVQQHHMIKSIFDKSFVISCEIPPLENTTATAIVARVREQDTFVLPGEVPFHRIRFDLKSGLSLFGTNEEPIKSNMYFVVSVRDKGEHKDMMVQNCYAHNTGTLNNRTTLFHLSNFYGCADSSCTLANFSVTNKTNDGSSLMAYALLKNFTLLSKKRIHFTCAVTLCKRTCPTICNGSKPLNLLMWSDVITKKIVRKRVNATLPKTMEMHNGGQRNRSKRSLNYIKSPLRYWESLNYVVDLEIGTTLANNGSIVDIANATIPNDLEGFTLEIFQTVKTRFALSRDYFYKTDRKFVQWSTSSFQVLCLFLFIVVTATIVFYCRWEDLLRNPRQTICSFCRSLR